MTLNIDYSNNSTVNVTIFHSGSILIATLMNSLSRKGTRASTPQAEVALLALRQSYRWRALICNTNNRPHLAIKTHEQCTGELNFRFSKAFTCAEYLSACFLVKFLLVGCLVEIQITTEYLIRSFTRNYHLYSQRLDLARHQKHRCASPNSCNIICFNMIYDLFKCIYAFLNSGKNDSIFRKS